MSKENKVKAIIQWIDTELEYHHVMMEQHGPADGSEEGEMYSYHNIAHIRLTQIKKILLDAECGND